MKIFIYLSLIIGLLSCQSAEKKSSSDDKAASEAITKVLKEQSDAWNKGDIDGFMKGYYHSDNLRFITKKGIKEGYDTIASRYKAAYPGKEQMGHLEFDHLIMRRLATEPELFQATGNWAITGTNNASGNFSLIFQKIDNEWKIIIDHTW